VKLAAQTDEVFLNDVRQTLASGQRRLWWLGQSGFLLVQKGRALVLDPYLSDSLTRKYEKTDKPHVRMTERVVDPAALGALGVVEVVTSSHNHTDHLDSETLVPLFASNPRARFVLPAANRSTALERLGPTVRPEIVAMDDGVTANIGDIQISGVAAAHPTVEKDSTGRCRYLGYVISWGGLTVYHSGDTLLHSGLVPSLRRFSIDLALLPINGDRPERRVAGNLDGSEAARLAHDIGARRVIPCHYDLFEFNNVSPVAFALACEQLRQGYCLLDNGQGLDL
jgi:L-ascorbate metabolism protein UlaG (beta-lactamase superfamily)